MWIETIWFWLRAWDVGHSGVRGQVAPTCLCPAPQQPQQRQRLTAASALGGVEAASLLGGEEAPKGGTSLWETSSQFLLLQLSSGCGRHQRGRVLMCVIKARASCQEAENASGLQRGRKPEKWPHNSVHEPWAGLSCACMGLTLHHIP